MLGSAAVMLGSFTYNIVLRLRGPIQPAAWARNMSDRRLWMLKGTLVAIVLVIAVVGLASTF